MQEEVESPRKEQRNQRWVWCNLSWLDGAHEEMTGGLLHLFQHGGLRTETRTRKVGAALVDGVDGVAR